MEGFVGSPAALADNFIAGLLASEADGVAKEVRERAESKAAERVVQLFSWYVILKFLREPSDSGDSSNAEVSKTRWRHILRGTFTKYLLGG